MTSVDSIAHTKPAIVRGNWWEDNWLSPYVRARFQCDAAELRMRIELFLPDTETEPMQIVFRMGGITVLGEETVEPRELRVIELPLPRFKSAQNQVDISLRTSRRFNSSADDQRNLGVLATEWYLVAAEG